MLSRIILLCMACVMAQTSEDVPGCREKQDLAFLMDTTETMNEQAVIMAQSLAITILERFTVSDEHTRAAFITFGDESMIKFDFKTFFTMEEVKLAISNDESLNDTASSLIPNSLNETLKVMELLFSNDFGSRDDVMRILIFLTNGKFSSFDKNITQGFLKQENIKLIVAGIGMEINKPSLEELVDDKTKDIFTEDEYNVGEMVKRIRELTDEYCDEKERPPIANNPTVIPTL